MARRAAVPVDAILERFSPEQFDELVALDRLEGDPDQRLREILKRGLAAACFAKIEPEQLDPQAEKREPAQTFAPRQLAAIFQAHHSAPG